MMGRRNLGIKNPIFVSLVGQRFSLKYVLNHLETLQSFWKILFNKENLNEEEEKKLRDLTIHPECRIR